MASAFDYGRFQLDAFQIDAPVLTPCEQDYVVDGYVEAGYICGVEVTQAGGGIGHGGKKRRVYVERDGKILLFNSNAEAAEYIQAEKAQEKPLESPKKASRKPVKTKKVAEPEVINVEAIKAYYAALQQQEQVRLIEEAIRKEQFDFLIRLQIHLNLWQQEEDDIELLLLAI